MDGTILEAPAEAENETVDATLAVATADNQSAQNGEKRNAALMVERAKLPRTVTLTVEVSAAVLQETAEVAATFHEQAVRLQSAGALASTETWPGAVAQRTAVQIAAASAAAAPVFEGAAAPTPKEDQADAKEDEGEEADPASQGGGKGKGKRKKASVQVKQEGDGTTVATVSIAAA